MNQFLFLRVLTIVSAAAFLAVATTAPTASGQDDADLAKEAKRLSGIWRVDVFEWDGQRFVAKDYQDKSSDVFESRWLFTATKADWIVSSDMKLEYARYKLNPRAKPKTIDIDVYGATFKGIYTIEGNKIKACFSVRNPEGKTLVPGKGGRPTDFTTKKKSERLLLIFVKDEKAKKK